MSSGRRAFCVMKTRMWVGVCLSGSGMTAANVVLPSWYAWNWLRAHKNRLSIDVSKGWSPYTWAMLLPVWVGHIGYEHASDRIADQSLSGSKGLPFLLFLPLSWFVLLRIQKMPPRYAPQHRPFPAKSLKIRKAFNFLHKMLEITN